MAITTTTKTSIALLLMLPASFFAFQAAGLSLPIGSGAPAIAAPETVVVAARSFLHRPAGEFLMDGHAVDAPQTVVKGSSHIAVMTYQVSVADYALCVAEAACKPQDGKGAGNTPVTGVSFDDAEAYAGWLSARTGQVWRLPTDDEWAFFAGSRFVDDALGLEEASDDPSRRWLAAYAREIELAGDGPAIPQPLGAHGFNEFGVADLSGNVWEWTSTCHSRTTLASDGSEVSNVQSCGVKVLGGRHRSAMSSFIRDARGGGCTTGRPPDNLGFRLVRDTRWYAPVLAWFGRA